MSNDPSTSHSTIVCISTIDVSLARDSNKTVESIKLSTKNEGSLGDIQTTLRPGDRHREKFDVPLELRSDDQISVSAGCRSRFRKPFVVVDIDLRDVECMRDDHGIKSYRKKIQKVEVVVAGCPPVSQAPGPISQMLDPVSQVPGHASPQSGELVATTTELIDTCAKFRVLVIGNSGVGKSALIRKMFGVEEVHVSQTIRGTAGIDQEYISRTNERFVVHDSLGFEAGDERNIEIVKEFVRRRQAMPRLEDQLHVIWLCVEVPYSGGRLVEVGVERFLKHQRDIIGDIPLVVVLTKMDMLDIQLGLAEPGKQISESERSKYLEEYCVKPLRKAAGRVITPVAVSVKEGYSESLADLFKTTGGNMARDRVHEAPRAMATIAQRVSVKEKIEMSIAVGKKKYWQRLLKSAFFRGHTFKECLEVICKDIITVWNFNDPDQCLLDDKFIGALLRTDNLEGPSTQSTMASFTALLTSGLELAKNLSEAGDITLTVAGSIATFAISILRATYEAYREAKDDVKILMAYIVDLICVMQAIFLIASDGRVTPEVLAIALQAYEVPRKVVHMLIKEFDGRQGVLPGGQDRVLDRIEELIWRHSISDHDVGQWRQKVGGGSPS